jgi:hypothetical protein
VKIEIIHSTKEPIKFNYPIDIGPQNEDIYSDRDYPAGNIILQTMNGKIVKITRA